MGPFYVQFGVECEQYCINLVCVAGNPAEDIKEEEVESSAE